MTTGLTAKSFQSLQLNAGVFLKNFTYDSATDAAALAALVKTAISSGDCLGATRGGGTFEATPNTREIEADGKRYGYVGSIVTDSWDIKLTSTLLEVTPENFEIALGAADVTGEGNKKTLTLKTAYSDDDYLDNIVWVGDTSNDGLVLIELMNALSTTGANFTFTDKGEGTLPVEFHAHQKTFDQVDTAPVKIVFFSKGA